MEKGRERNNPSQVQIMAFAQPGSEGREKAHPFAPQSDTSRASSSSDYPTSTIIKRITAPAQRHESVLRQSNPLNTINTTTASNPLLARPPSVPSSPLRRKPLPVTASHLATRFSSGDPLKGMTIDNLEPPVQITRPISLDSPTLHDFPPTDYQTAAIRSGDPGLQDSR